MDPCTREQKRLRPKGFFYVRGCCWLAPRQARWPMTDLPRATSTSLCPRRALRCTSWQPVCMSRVRTRRTSGENARKAPVLTSVVVNVVVYREDSVRTLDCCVTIRNHLILAIAVLSNQGRVYSKRSGHQRRGRQRRRKRREKKETT